jgi:GT2 family glycosyltransferase
LPHDLSVAIVNWNTTDLLERALDSLLKNAAGLRLQVLVADNASSDGSAAMVKRRFPQVTLLETGANLGFARAHNLLLQRADAPFHLLLNSDVTVPPGLLHGLLHTFATQPKAGIVGPQMRDEHGAIQCSCRRFPTLLRQARQASGLAWLFPKCALLNGTLMTHFDHRSSQGVDQVIGACFAIRRELLQAIGHLDEAFFMYYEEVDFCRRAALAGYSTWFAADWHAIHLGGASANRVRELTVRRMMRSMRHYFNKHHGSWTWLPLLFILSLEMVTRSAQALLRRSSGIAAWRAYARAWLDVARRAPSREAIG